MNPNRRDLLKIAVALPFFRHTLAQCKPEAVVISSAMQTLRTMFGKIPEPNANLLTRWSDDPFSWGSYSSLKAGSSPADIAALAAPIGKLHFAGEATSKTHLATVHGALQSGQRAADEIR